MPECPYCGKWYKTKAGLKQHITKSHTSKLPFGDRIIDPMTFDPLGRIERKAKRTKRRKIL